MAHALLRAASTRREKNDWALYDTSGGLIQKLPADSPDAIASRLRALSRKPAASRWKQSIACAEVSAARDVPARDRPPLVSTLV